MKIKNVFQFKIEIPFKEKIIEEAIKQRQFKTEGFNFFLQTNYKADLYNIFITKCKKLFKKVTFVEEEFNVWCSVSDKNYTLTNWHNHENTANINGVIYIKTCSKEKGIDFKIDNKIINYVPSENELLIFPSTLWHHPNVSTNEEKRISLNLELLTKENTIDLFKKENINEI